MASEKDIQDVIRTLIAEGAGEGKEGMRRIAETILNRSEQRGITPAEVVRQAKQYTGYESPGPAAVKAFNDPAALSAAQAAWQLAQGPDDPTGGANHYFNPNIVTPKWASAMTPTGQFGNHAFYTDRAPTPPRVPPVPASLSPTGAAVRQMTSPSGGNTALQSALDTYATRERNRVTPAPVEDRVTARNRQFFGSPAFNGDPLTPAAGTVVASIPTRPSLPQSYAGQDRSPVTARQIAAAPGVTIASIPTVSAPTTRTVASIPMPPRSNGIGAGSNVAQQRSEQQIQRTPRALPNQYQLAAATGFRVPQAAQVQPGAPIPDRLTAQNTLPVDPRTVAQVPTPPRAPTMVAAAPRIAPVPFQRPTAVGSALDVVPMPPLPIPRPINRGAPLPPLPIPRPGIGGPEGPAAPNFFGIPLPQMPSIPPQMQTLANRTATIDGALRALMTTPRVNAGSGGYDRTTGTFNNPLSGGSGMSWNDGSGTASTKGQRR